MTSTPSPIHNITSLTWQGAAPTDEAHKKQQVAGLMAKIQSQANASSRTDLATALSSQYQITIIKTTAGAFEIKTADGADHTTIITAPANSAPNAAAPIYQTIQELWALFAPLPGLSLAGSSHTPTPQFSAPPQIQLLSAQALHPDEISAEKKAEAELILKALEAARAHRYRSLNESEQSRFKSMIQQGALILHGPLPIIHNDELGRLGLPYKEHYNRSALDLYLLEDAQNCIFHGKYKETLLSLSLLSPPIKHKALTQLCLHAQLNDLNTSSDHSLLALELAKNYPPTSQGALEQVKHHVMQKLEQSRLDIRTRRFQEESQAHLQQLQSDNQALAKCAQGLKRTLTMQQALIVATPPNPALQAELARSQEALRSLQAQLEALQTQHRAALQARNLELSPLQKELESARTKAAHLEASLATLQATQATALSSAHLEITALQTQMSTLKASLTQAHEHETSLHKQLTAGQTENTHQASQLKTLSDQIERMKGNLTELRTTEAQATQRAQETQSSLQKAQTELAELRKNQSLSKTQLGTALLEVSQKDERLARLIAACRSADTQLGQMAENLLTLVNQLQTLTAEKEAQKATLEARITELESTLRQKDTKLTEVRDQLDQAHEALRELEEGERKDKKQLIERIRSLGDQIATERPKFKDEVLHLQTQLHQAHLTTQHQQTEIDRYLALIAALQERQGKLESSVTESLDLIQQQTTQIQQAQAEIRTLQGSLDLLTSSQATLQAAHDEQVATIALQTQELATVKAELESTQSLSVTQEQELATGLAHIAQLSVLLASQGALLDETQTALRTQKAKEQRLTFQIKALETTKGHQSNRVEELKDQTAQLEQELEVLRLKLTGQEQTHTALQQQLQESLHKLTETDQNLKIALTKLAFSAKHLKTQSVQFAAQEQRLQSQLGNQSGQIAQLQESFRLVSHENSAQAAQLAAALSAHQTLLQKLTQLKTDHAQQLADTQRAHTEALKTLQAQLSGSKGENAALLSQLQAATAEIFTLKAAQSTLENQRLDQDQALVSLQTQNLQQSNTLATLEAERSSVTLQLQQARMEHEQASLAFHAEKTTFKQELLNLKTAYGQLTTEQEATLVRLNTTLAALDQQNSDQARLESQLKAQQALIEQLEAKGISQEEALAHKESQRATLQKVHTALQATHQSSNERNTALHTQIQHLAGLKKDHEAQLAAQTAQIASQDMRYSLLESTFADSQTRVQTLETSLEQTKSSFGQKSAALKVEIASLKLSMTELKTRTSQDMSEMAQTLQTHLLTQSSQISDLKDQIAALKAAASQGHGTLSRALDKAQTQLAALEASHAALRSAKDSRTSQLQALLDAMRAESQKLSAQLATLHSDNSSLNAQLATLQQTNLEHTSSLKDLSAQLLEREAKIEQQAHLIASLEHSLQEKQTLAQQQEQEHSSALASLKQKKQKADESLEAAKTDFQERLQALSSTHTTAFLQKLQQITTLENRLAALSQAQEALNVTCEAQKEKLQNQQEKIASLHSDSSRLTGLVTKRELQLVALAAHLSSQTQKQQVFMALKTALLRSKTEKLAQQEQTLATRQSTIQKLQDELASKLGQAVQSENSLKEFFVAKLLELDPTQTDLTSLSAPELQERLSSKMKEFKIQLLELNQVAATDRGTISALQGQLTEQRAEATALSAHIATTQDTLKRQDRATALVQQEKIELEGQLAHAQQEQERTNALVINTLKQLQLAEKTHGSAHLQLLSQQGTLTTQLQRSQLDAEELKIKSAQAVANFEMQLAQAETRKANLEASHTLELQSRGQAIAQLQTSVEQMGQQHARQVDELYTNHQRAISKLELKHQKALESSEGIGRSESERLKSVHQQELTRLSAQNKEAQTALQADYEKKLAAKQSTLGELEQKYQALEAQLETLKAEKIALTEKKAEFELTISSQADALQKASARVSELSKALEATRALETQLNDTSAKILAKQQELDTKLQAAFTSIRELTDKCQEQQSSNARLLSEKTDLETRLADSVVAFSALQNAKTVGLAQLDSKLAQAEACNASLEALYTLKLAEQASTIENLQTLIDQMRIEHAQKLDQLAQNGQRNLSELDSKHQAALSHLSKLQSSKIETLELAHQEARVSLSAKNEEAINALQVEHERRLAAKEDELVQLQGDFAHLTTEHLALQATLKTITAEKTALGQEKAQLEGSITTLTQEKADLEQTLASQAADLAAARAYFETEKAALTKEQSALSQNMYHLESSMTLKEDELQKALAHNLRLNGTIEQLKEQLQGLKSSSSKQALALSAQIAALTASKAQDHAETLGALTQMTQQLNLLKGKLPELGSILESMPHSGSISAMIAHLAPIGPLVQKHLDSLSSAYQHTLSTEQARYEALVLQEQALQSTQQALQARLVSEEAQVEMLTQRNKALTAELNVAQDSLVQAEEAFKKNIADLTASAEGDLRALALQLEASKARISSLEEVLKRAETTLAAETTDRLAIRTELASNQADMARFLIQIGTHDAKMQKQLQEQVLELASAKSKIQSLEEALTPTAELIKARTRITELSTQNGKLTTENARLLGEKSELHGRLEKQASELIETKGKNNQLARELHHLYASMAELRSFYHSQLTLLSRSKATESPARESELRTINAALIKQELQILTALKKIILTETTTAEGSSSRAARVTLLAKDSDPFQLARTLEELIGLKLEALTRITSAESSSSPAVVVTGSASLTTKATSTATASIKPTGAGETAPAKKPDGTRPLR